MLKKLHKFNTGKCTVILRFDMQSHNSFLRSSASYQYFVNPLPNRIYNSIVTIYSYNSYNSYNYNVIVSLCLHQYITEVH